MSNRLYILVACVSIFFFSCEEHTKTTFSEISISTENNTSVEINIPKANGNSRVIDSINSSIEKAVITALQIGVPDNIELETIEESIASFNKEFETFKTDFPESLQIWDAQIDGEVLFQSPEIISISITSYVNTGGAHGILHISFLNFDSITGKRITNKNLFTNIGAFKEIAQTHFDKAIKEKDILFETDKFELPANIGYTEDGLVLLYNTYEIAPYSTGIIEFAIPFDEIESYLVFNSAH
tara:strand:+ start:111 stop:833 length:723 start_codon:yes stop_codon:yes gene_type:complete